MPLAVFSDVHANLPALEAVLEDVERLGVEDVVCLGDVVGFGPQPEETVDLLRKRAVPVLLGNHEEAVIERAPADAPAAVTATATWTRGRLSARSLDWLKRLPRERRLVLKGKAFLLTHASPGSVWTPLDDAAPADELLDILRDARADYLVVGHTHRLALRDAGRGVVANCGSVGLPFDGPEAAYLVFSEEDGVLQASERRVPYDAGRFLAEMRKAGRATADLPEAARRHLPRER